MRLITIRTPEGEGNKVVEIAFEKGIEEAAISTAAVHRSGKGILKQDVVNIETTTPLAKNFIEAFMEAPFYDPKSYSFTIRHPESLFGAKPPKEETIPIIRPTTDVYQELYQFTQVTFSLIGRVFISAVLLSYGILEDFMPIIIAGLLFCAISPQYDWYSIRRCHERMEIFPANGTGTGCQHVIDLCSWCWRSSVK